MIVYIVVAAIAAYFIFDFIRSFNWGVGSVWQRVLAGAKNSATILWSRFTVVVAAVASALIQVADLVNAPSVATAIQTYLKPSTVAAIMVTVAVISEWARRRTL